MWLVGGDPCHDTNHKGDLDHASIRKFGLIRSSRNNLSNKAALVGLFCPSVDAKDLSRSTRLTVECWFVQNNYLKCFHGKIFLLKLMDSYQLVSIEKDRWGAQHFTHDYHIPIAVSNFPRSRMAVGWGQPLVPEASESSRRSRNDGSESDISRSEPR